MKVTVEYSLVRNTGALKAFVNLIAENEGDPTALVLEAWRTLTLQVPPKEVHYL